MPPITDKLVEQAVAILGTADISEAEIESRVFALAQDSMLARRLIDWPPEAFGFVLVRHIAKVKLPTTFSAKARSGKWVELSFELEPIFHTAVRLGLEMYHSGEGDTFSNVALRSSVVGTVNRALNQGSSLEGAALSGPALIGIPAEVYMADAKLP
jgi:hypothetical protein